jgi:hypothetical protein
VSRHRSSVSAFTDEPDDETGYLVTDGHQPREVQGRHCATCGEHVELRPVPLPLQAGPYVVEFQHARTQTVHCVIAWQGLNVVALAEETARPCWKDGCLSNDEHDAKRAAGRDGG